MLHMTTSKVTCALLFFGLLSACSLREIPLPTPTVVVIPTLAASPTAAPTPLPTNTPAPTPTPVIVVERGQLPPGFSLTVYANVPAPARLAFGPDGKLYVASDRQVQVFWDHDGDQRASLRSIFVEDLTDTPLGLLWVGERLYVSYNHTVVAMQDTNGDFVQDESSIILENLPTGLHQNDGLVLGADGYIYMGLGSTCDVCKEDNPLSASILRFKPDGSDLSVFASGLRNPYGIAFNAAGDLFATDNGRDALGDDVPLEELNHIRAGLHYGWPDCWEGNTIPECADKTGAVVGFTAHSSVDGFAFYNAGNFPLEYHDNAFVAVFGSYLLPEIPRGVKRVKLTKQGDTYTGQEEWFLQLDTNGRPLDVIVGPDGALYVADFMQSAVYRIVYGAP